MRITLLVGLALLLGTGIGLGSAALRIATVPWRGYLSGGSDDPEVIAARAAKTLPRAYAPQMEYDFGTLDFHGHGRHEFTIQNTGMADLQLTEGPTTCGCTDLDVPNEPIPAGKSVVVAVAYKAKEGVGPYEQSGIVRTNDPGNPQIKLTVKGEIVASALVVPAEATFSQLSVGDEATVEVRVYAYRTKRFEIRASSFEQASTASKFAVRWQPLPKDEVAKEKNAQSGFLIKITAKSGLPLGAIQQTITLQTDLTDRPTISIPILGDVTSDISVFGSGWNAQRSVLDIGVVASSGAERALVIVIRGPHRKEVDFKLAQTTPDWLDVKLGPALATGDAPVVRRELKIRIPPGTRPANFLGPKRSDMGRIVIETTHPQVPQLIVHVAFTVEG